MGNLRSVWNALDYLGSKPVISSQKRDFQDADAFILPGVGAFGQAMDNLVSNGTVDFLTNEVIEKKKPLLGICLGMQMLASESEEGNGCKGLGWIPGKVKRLHPQDQVRIPHIGWNDVKVQQPSPLFNGVSDLGSYYFLHSYTLDSDDKFVVAVTNYGGEIQAVIQKENVFGVQFHPERSSQKGLSILENFIKCI